MPPLLEAGAASPGLTKKLIDDGNIIPLRSVGASFIEQARAGRLFPRDSFDALDAFCDPESWARRPENFAMADAVGKAVRADATWWNTHPRRRFRIRPRIAGEFGATLPRCKNCAPAITLVSRVQCEGVTIGQLRRAFNASPCELGNDVPEIADNAALSFLEARGVRLCKWEKRV